MYFNHILPQLLSPLPLRHPQVASSPLHVLSSFEVEPIESSYHCLLEWWLILSLVKLVSTLIFEIVSLTEHGLTDLVRQVGHWAPNICLSPSPQSQGSTCTTMCCISYMGSGGLELRPFCLQRKHFTHRLPSLYLPRAVIYACVCESNFLTATQWSWHVPFLISSL